VQMNKTPEDFGEIRRLQADLRQALIRWDAIDGKSRKFDDLVPAVDKLEDALRGLQRRRLKASACRLGGWAGLTADLVLLALMIFGGWNTALVVITVVAVTCGALLLVVGGQRG
jgi:hypothetical protein